MQIEVSIWFNRLLTNELQNKEQPDERTKKKFAVTYVKGFQISDKSVNLSTQNEWVHMQSILAHNTQIMSFLLLNAMAMCSNVDDIFLSTYMNNRVKDTRLEFFGIFFFFCFWICSEFCFLFCVATLFWFFFTHTLFLFSTLSTACPDQHSISFNRRFLKTSSWFSRIFTFVWWLKPLVLLKNPIHWKYFIYFFVKSTINERWIKKICFFLTISRKINVTQLMSPMEIENLFSSKLKSKRRDQIFLGCVHD